MTDALLIFIKNAIPGKVKTRLAATLGDEQALKIYRALLDRTRAASLSVAAARHLFYSDFIEENDGWREEDFFKKKQRGGELGERMANAFKEAFERHERVVVIGSDAPGLSGETLAEAFEKLATHDFVVGPALDGGYYLLGMRQFQPAVFQGIAWSTDAVFSKTMEIIGQLGKSCHLLPALSDVDFEEDWKQHGWQI